MSWFTKVKEAMKEEPLNGQELIEYMQELLEAKGYRQTVAVFIHGANQRYCYTHKSGSTLWLELEENGSVDCSFNSQVLTPGQVVKTLETMEEVSAGPA
jgi:hypothetical protein